MNTNMKIIGVHDRCTYKPMAVFKLIPENVKEFRILFRVGLGYEPENYTFFYDVIARECTYDPYKLTDQLTCGTAARYIRDDLGFSDLEPGAFLDCEFIRGEKEAPMTFEDEFDTSTH